MIDSRPQLRFSAPLTTAVKGLLILNIAVFLLAQISNDQMAQLFGLPSWTKVVTYGSYWQPFTYLFMHGSITHLLFNMLVLWMFGGEVEIILGQGRFLRFYLLTGIGAGLLTSFFQDSVIIGSSGAIFGLMVAYGMLFPNRIVLLMLVFPIRVKYMVVILCAVEVILTWSEARDGISHLTHLSGGLLGCLYLLVFLKGFPLRKLRASRRRRSVRVVALPRQTDVPQPEDHENDHPEQPKTPTLH
ncbi:MAG: hypothetical protein A2284_13775 [Deltaproteobacteria bacterium RIFOXYA12_FULL_61_11]|nr:MAG: hypothetical protein A2284_13775 [Deltaproteobacteria bacterium RIFOXYA12_FULL_61_11]